MSSGHPSLNPQRRTCSTSATVIVPARSNVEARTGSAAGRTQRERGRAQQAGRRHRGDRPAVTTFRGAAFVAMKADERTRPGRSRQWAHRLHTAGRDTHRRRCVPRQVLVFNFLPSDRLGHLDGRPAPGLTRKPLEAVTTNAPAAPQRDFSGSSTEASTRSWSGVRGRLGSAN